jgi:hypothetical protein
VARESHPDPAEIPGVTMTVPNVPFETVTFCSSGVAEPWTAVRFTGLGLALMILPGWTLSTTAMFWTLDPEATAIVAE